MYTDFFYTEDDLERKLQSLSFHSNAEDNEINIQVELPFGTEAAYGKRENVTVKLRPELLPVSDCHHGPYRRRRNSLGLADVQNECEIVTFGVSEGPFSLRLSFVVRRGRWRQQRFKWSSCGTSRYMYTLIRRLRQQALRTALYTVAFTDNEKDSTITGPIYRWSYCRCQLCQNNQNNVKTNLSSKLNFVDECYNIKIAATNQKVRNPWEVCDARTVTMRQVCFRFLTESAVIRSWNDMFKFKPIDEKAQRLDD
jgi:hypothetical protein